MLAEIYGIPESEKKILNRSPKGVYKFQDIDELYQGLKSKLEKKKNDFFESLPERKDRVRNRLKTFRKEKWETIRKYENEIRKMEVEIKEKKTEKRWFSVFSNHIKIFFKKHISKPLKVRNMNKSRSRPERSLFRLEEYPLEVFKNEHHELVKKVDRFEKIKKDSFYYGAKGEIEVLKRLSELGEDYKILCGLNIELDDWQNYYGEYNLKSSQMDLVVVSNKGVFVIEVKNWTDEYLDKHNGLYPHEQVDRAGHLLYKFIQSFIGNKIQLRKNHLNKVLVSIKSNLRYDPNYWSVKVKNVSEINSYIKGKKDVLEDDEVNKIKNLLKPFVTKR